MILGGPHRHPDWTRSRKLITMDKFKFEASLHGSTGKITGLLIGLFLQLHSSIPVMGAGRRHSDLCP